jgi:hypothetical protein
VHIGQVAEMTAIPGELIADHDVVDAFCRQTEKINKRNVYMRIPVIEIFHCS